MGGCRAARIGPAAEARLLLPMLLARRARERRRWPECAAHVLAALRLVAAPAGLEAPLAARPVRHSRGGFFTALVETPAGPLFAKGVPARSRETRFWTAWQGGGVRAEGSHYRLVPPLAMVTGRVASILVFPALDGLDTRREARQRRFERHALAVARALADFNSDHLALPAGIAPGRGCGPVPVPGARQVVQALGVDPGQAEALVAEARAIEGKWRPVRDVVERGARCLSHMDLGRGNVLLGDGPVILLDFGHAGAAPVGADLHTVLRFAGASGPGTEALVDAYAAVFAQKGLAVDPVAVRRSLEAHFAARYRDLRFASARHADTYAAALALSRELIEAG